MPSSQDPTPRAAPRPDDGRRLAPGTELGGFEVTGFVGEGAMGQVYRARDARLDREVAIKILPPDLTGDPERLRRLETEARSLGSLNHPNISQIYGIDHAGDTHFLALEFVPGESLDERLGRGRMPVDEVVAVCRDIADGLESAHETGVVHRDLKPANVRLMPSGTAKVLDFGLAKSCRESGAAASAGSSAATVPGVVLGTPAYMSPEQVAGKPVDRRTDIWAFGCLLYECLTGQRAFGEPTFSEVAASIAGGEPDYEPLERTAPPRLVRLVQGCLRKDPRTRLRDIGDARLELEAVIAGEMEPSAAAPAKRRPSRWPQVAALGAVALAGAIVAHALLPGDPSGEAADGATRWYSITLPNPSRGLVLDTPTGSSPPLAVSPDGQRIVFVARDEAGEPGVYSRTSSSAEIVALGNAGSADFVLFSEDGRHLAYASYGAEALSTISPDGSTSEILTKSGGLQGASWDGGDRLVFSEQGSGLQVTLPGSDRLSPLTDLREGEIDHRWPQHIPGGELLLYTAHVRSVQQFEIRVLDIASGVSSTVPTVHGAFARFLPSAESGRGDGFLVYEFGGDIYAIRFDPATARTVGIPRLAATEIHVSQLGTPHFAVASSGVLVYEPKRPPSPGRRLMWVDRQGNETPFFEGKAFEFPRLSPDGTRAVFAHHGADGIHEVWAVDFGGPHPYEERIITSDGNWIQPTWAPDSTGVAVSDFRKESRNLWIQDSRSEPPRELVLDGRPGWQLPTQWHDSGRLVFQEMDSQSGRKWDVLELDLGTMEVRELLAEAHSETAGALSPSGNWLAYVSNHEGNPAVYLRRYQPDGPLGGERSVAPGTEPRWSADGSELFFRRGAAMFTVRISDEDGRPLGEPEKLFSGPYVAGFNEVCNYDVTPDGERFLMVAGGFGLTTGRLEIRLDFLRELGELLPVAE